ncbi:phage terminase large subunit family protein [Halocatena halophila]|uniref:phage terminase large subunit family protein n=1 Tax=Halocatena halophila TaxID=2814576 RepID=UPI002ED19C93
MSATGAPDPHEHYQQLKQQPLCHPGIFAREEFDFQYELPPHLGEIYHSVFQAFDDNYSLAPKNIVRLQPREHAKSESGSHIIPSWLALRNPNARILIMMETEGQAKGKLRECSDTIERLGPKYGAEIVENNKTELTLERDANWDVPTIKAAGFNTGVTGGHYDLIVFDDLISWESQRTEQRREKTWEQFQDYLNLGSEGETIFLVLGTRKHPNDLYQRLIDGPAWDTRVERAISDWSIVEEGAYTLVTDANNRYGAGEIGTIPEEETVVKVDPHRDVGVLWKDRWPLDKLLLDMVSGFGSEQGTLVWQRENQNDASALQGQILSADMLYYVDELPNQRSYYSWYAGVDPAIEDDPEKAATNDTDYWAAAVLAHDRKRETTYVTDLHRRRGLTIDQGIQWLSNVLPGDVRSGLVENVQAQRWLVQSAKDEGLPLEGSPSSGTKEDRIIAMSGRFESGKVKLVVGNTPQKWESFESEWAGFPSGNHDDRLDAIEIGLRNLSMNGQPQIHSYST